jgi:hypothetical protein
MRTPTCPPSLGEAVIVFRSLAVPLEVVAVDELASEAEVCHCKVREFVYADVACSMHRPARNVHGVSGLDMNSRVSNFDGTASAHDVNDCLMGVPMKFVALAARNADHAWIEHLGFEGKPFHRKVDALGRIRVCAQNGNRGPVPGARRSLERS